MNKAALLISMMLLLVTVVALADQPIDKCTIRCRDAYLRCVDRAFHNQDVRDRKCESITDPIERQKCLNDSANEWATEVNGCVDQNVTCLNGCYN